MTTACNAVVVARFGGEGGLALKSAREIAAYCGKYTGLCPETSPRVKGFIRRDPLNLLLSSNEIYEVNASCCINVSMPTSLLPISKKPFAIEMK